MGLHCWRTLDRRVRQMKDFEHVEEERTLRCFSVRKGDEASGIRDPCFELRPLLCLGRRGRLTAFSWRCDSTFDEGSPEASPSSCRSEISTSLAYLNSKEKKLTERSIEDLFRLD